MLPSQIIAAALKALSSIVSVVAKGLLGLFIYNKGKQAEQLEVSQEVINDVRKANEARDQAEHNAAAAERVRSQFTRPD